MAREKDESNLERVIIGAWMAGAITMIAQMVSVSISTVTIIYGKAHVNRVGNCGQKMMLVHYSVVSKGNGRESLHQVTVGHDQTVSLRTFHPLH